MTARQRVRNCRDCGIRLAPEQAWRSWSNEQRKASGAKRHMGRGLCSVCYNRALTLGNIETAPRSNLDWDDLLADLLDAGLDLNQPITGQLRNLAPRFGLKPDALLRRWGRNKRRLDRGKDYAEPTDADALPPGRWVTDGLIQRFIPDTSPVSAAAASTAADEEAGVPAPEQAERVERPGHVAPRPPVACKPILFAGRPVCACGCLLSRDGETCPACEYDRIDLNWCEREAVAASWRPDYYKPTSEVIEIKGKTDTYLYHEMTADDSSDFAREGPGDTAANMPGSTDRAPQVSDNQETLGTPEVMREVA